MNPRFFNLIGGYAINPEHVSMIDLRSPNQTVLHIGNNSLTFVGDDNDKFRERFFPAPERASPAALIPEGKDFMQASITRANAEDGEQPGEKPAPEIQS